MRITTDEQSQPGKLGRRLLWFIAIYAASVLVFAAVSFLLEMLLPK